MNEDEARRLDAASALPPTVAVPRYRPEDHGEGIVHIGIGAFHRAHQAVYTDDALAAAGGDWRIVGASLRGTDAADQLNPQKCRYTVIERGPHGDSARVIGSVSRVIAAAREPGAMLAALEAPGTRIVSTSVTEKAYGIDRATGGVIADHASIAPDLAAPRAPRGTLGLIVEGLRRRREAGLHPFTVLCCDNLPENGRLLRAGTLDFACRVDPGLAEWIEATVAFPSTMVDRITPASTERTFDDALRMTGFADRGAVETEPFSQWVIEDRFPAGRPAWEKGGAIFVDDVTAYEDMKLRMLNGTHSLMAYAGFLAGHRFVRDCMADAALERLVARHLGSAASTLSAVGAIDLGAYADQLRARFANPAIAHETYQIAMDGTEKLPQRAFAPVRAVLARAGDPSSYAFLVAAWMRYCLGRHDDSTRYALRDPREAEIASALAAGGEGAQGLYEALCAMPNLVPSDLASDAAWRHAVTGALSRMLEDGMAAAIRTEAG